MNLSGRLTLVMVTLVLVTAAVVGVLTYRNLVEAILPSELARLQAHAGRQAAYLDEVITAVRGDVQAFTTGVAAFEGIARARSNGGVDPEDGSSEEVWRMRLARRFTAELHAKPAYMQIRFIGVADGGREIVRVDRSGPEGSVRVVPDRELQAKGDRDYFVGTIKLAPGAIYLSRIDLNQEHGKIEVPHLPVIRAATPVCTAKGEAFGILIVNVDLRRAFNRMNTPEHPGGQVFVVNRDGYYLRHPQSEKAFGFDLGGDDRLQRDYPALADALGTSEGFTRLIPSQADEALGVALMPLRAEGVPWAAVVEVVPKAQLLAAVTLVRRSSLMAGCAVTLLAVGLAVWVSRSLTKPLVTLTRTVESFSSGKAAPEKIAAAGEIGMLAHAFEHMQQEVSAKTEALRHSEHRFRALLEHSADGIALIDATNKILYLSPSVSVIEGYSPEELIGRNGTENTHPDDMPLVADVVEKLVASPGKPIPVLWRRRHKDGRWLWLEGVATNLLADPAIGAIVTNYRDVTERKRMEAAAARLVAIVEFSDDGIVGKDLSGIVTSWNAGAEKIFGYSALEMVGQSIVRLIPPERRHEETEILTRIRRGENVRHFDTVRLRKDGSTVDVSVTVSAIRGSAGSIIGASKVVRDITERRRTDQAIRESEERFRFLNNLVETTRTLADPAQIMAVTARMLGEHLRVSRCAYADVEQDGEQFTILHDYTDDCASTVGKYQLSLFGARAVATLHRGQTLVIRNVEAELLPGEGADMFNAIGIKAIITCPLVKEGVLRAMMAVHQAAPRDWKPGEIALVEDVVERCWATIERRTAEERINLLNTELEHRVVERTRQLEAANKELEAFSYSVSHDLRTPLRAVDGFSQAVLEDYGPALPAEGRRQLQTIRESAQRMGELIDDLLAFSKLSRQGMRQQPVETGPLVQAALADLAADRNGRQIDIKIGELPACVGDPALLKHVWLNLLSNALKYTGKRQSAIIEVGSIEQPAGPVYFIRDNGAGFDMRYVHKLFGVFQRLHRAEDYEGTGVGLAIVQRIIHRHGGRIWAEAAVDRGATFYFTLNGGT